MEVPEVLKSPDLDGSSYTSSHLGSSLASNQHFHQPPTSSPSAFLQAQEINQRRLILEAQHEKEVSSESDMVLSPSECPPSPDDLRTETKLDFEPTPLSPDVLGGGQLLSTTTSSIDGFTNSSVSVTQSTSNPSFVATSGASSPPELEYQTLNDNLHPKSASSDPYFMKSEDTITDHARPAPTAPGKSLQQEQEDELYAEGDDEDSDDEVIMMSTKKK